MKTIFNCTITVAFLLSLTLTAQKPGDSRHIAGNKNQDGRREWRREKRVKQNRERHLRQLQHHAVTEAKKSLHTRVAGIEIKRHNKKIINVKEKKGANSNSQEKKEPFLNRLLNKFKKHDRKKNNNNPS